ncbi:MAG: hypothetical protein LAN71_11780 [Acidobacteriia bacterium]|nr:hypothetical protein [Terriglobia bacterium]
MFSAMLFLLTFIALAQFAAYYGRAVLANTAARTVSSQVLAVAGIHSRPVSRRDFDFLLTLHRLTPNLGPSASGLFFVSLYFRFLTQLSLLSADQFPRLTTLTRHERTLCARYAAVQLDLRLQASYAFTSSIRSN